jgi:hypothetical protein
MKSNHKLNYRSYYSTVIYRCYTLDLLIRRTPFECLSHISLGEVYVSPHPWQLIHTYICLSRTAFECPSIKSLGEVPR